LLLEDVNLMSGARELLRAGHAGRPRADDGHLLAGHACGRFRLHPAFGKTAICDRAFDRLDRHRRVFEIKRAGRFAWRRANAAGEFRKIVGRV
jgi:hypothetical protein